MVLCVYVIKNKRDTMKTLRFFYLLLCGIMLQGLTCWGYAQSPIPGYDDFPVPIDEEHFPDGVFRQFVSENYDIDGDRKLSFTEAKRGTSLSLYSMGIESLEGIKYFFSLQYLYCSENQLTALDVSGCTALQHLYCSENQLTSLDVSGCLALKDIDWQGVTSFLSLQRLNCSNSGLVDLYFLLVACKNLKTLDVSGCASLTTLNTTANDSLVFLGVDSCTALQTLYCYGNQLASLDVSGCTALKTLYCYGNQLASLDVSGCTALKTLYCYGNQLTSLDVEVCASLEELNCSNNPITCLNCTGLNLRTLYVFDCTSLTYLDCSDNSINGLSAFNNTSLTFLDCSNNNMTRMPPNLGSSILDSLNCSNNNINTLDLHDYSFLSFLDCSSNGLVDFDVSNCIYLQYLDVSENDLTILDVSNCAALTFLDCSSNKLEQLDVSQCSKLAFLDCSDMYRYRQDWSGYYADGFLDSLNVSGCTSLSFLDCSRTGLWKLDLSENVSLRDLNCGANNLNMLDVSTCALLETLDCGGIFTYNTGGFGDVYKHILCNRLVNLDLRNCTKLKSLACSDVGLMVLDLEGFEFLEDVDCSSNQLTDLNTNGCTALVFLKCNDNDSLVHIDVSGCTSLETLECEHNALETLDVSGCTALTALNCYDNALKTLNVSGCTALTALNCYGNALKTLGVSDCTVLESIDCYNNHLSSLDLSGCSALASLDCSNNQLTNLDVSGCTVLQDLDCSSNQLSCLNLSSVQGYRFSAEDNVRSIRVGMNQEFDLALLPGFVVDSISFLKGGTLEGTLLRFEQGEVRYRYNTGLVEVEFALKMLPPVGFDMDSFPDSVFCQYVVENYDSDQDGYLTEGEILSVVSMDVSGMGIHNLQGIEYFTFLESLDCSDNHLTSLDLSSNTRLRDLQADSNCLDVKVDDEKRFYLSELPGFDLSKVSGWEGGYVEDSILYFEEEMVTYSYVVDNGGFEDVVFMLRTDFPVLIPINNETFPDEAFRAYVSENVDVSHNGNLNEGEINSVTTMDVSGLGIRSLQGMEYFTALESLNCSDNELTSLDLSSNTNLQNLDAEDNRLNVVLDGDDAFDLSSLPNFDIDRASDWNGAVLNGNMLTFTQQEATYLYATAYTGENENEDLQSVWFTLVADRDPSVGNEAIEDQPQGRVYAKDRTIFTEGLSGEVSVFTTVGTLVYQGQSNRIPVRQAGIYIVRNSGNTWKLLVM